MRPASPAALTWLRLALTSEAALAPRTARTQPPSRLLHTTRIRPSSSHNSASNPPLHHPRHLSTSTPRPSASPSQSPPTPTATATPPQTPPQTHYDLFPQTFPHGPPPASPFTIDLAALRKEFLALQARAHPDLHPPPHKPRAQALSARINDAYRTLCSPLQRAQYLLSLRGIDVSGDEAARVEDDVGLLDEVMEAREAIEEAGGEEEVEVLRAVNEARVESSVRGLEEAFAGGDVEAARREAVRLRYWVNIRESLDAWERGSPVVLVH
ncbi:Co-chaperone Hsc20 [Glonium stellatum]|uniref:Co-chaperone Hsc20 n=1 Tax=Glonium stellatum TaxID=574774 RepID=A0A8E2F177_9PEZI|nr:Co-chaperone Hsc20 [Glonium stellatum]